jgi:hypothetical protein
MKHHKIDPLPLGWRKSDSQRKRRLYVLISHNFDYLKAAHSLNYLANITSDNETAHKSRADATYLFAKYRVLRKNNA